MFARLPDVVAAEVAVTIDGAPFAARAGDTVAAALLASGSPRVPHDARHGRAARAVLHDGRVLRLPRHDRRPSQPAGVHDRRRRRACASRRGRACAAPRPTPETDGDDARRRDRRRRSRRTRGGDAGRRARAVGVALRRAARARRAGLPRHHGAAARRAPTILGDDYWRGASLVPPFERSGARYVRDATVWAIARARRRHVRRLGQHRAAGCAHDDDGRSARGDPRDRRAGATVSRSRVDAARRDDGRRRADPAEDLRRRAARAHGARRLRAAAVAARVAIRCAPALRSTRCSTRRRAGASPKRCAHAPAFVLSPYFAKGRELVRTVRRSVRVVEFVSELAIEGDDAAQAVRYRAGGREETLPADHVLLHQGVVPDVNLAGAARLRARVERAAGVLRAGRRRVGRHQRSGALRRGRRRGHRRRASPRRRAAGWPRSRPPTRSAASTRTARDRAAQRPLRELAQALRGRRFLDVLYRPPDAFRVPTGATLACRCEEVPRRRRSSRPRATVARAPTR